MPGGWGRRAAGKFDQKLEDDELFKAIGGQLEDSNFDYTQWQRQKAKVSSKRPPPPKKPTAGGFDRPHTVSSFAGTLRRSGSAASSCHHGAHPKKPIVDDAAEKKRAESLKILQLRIRARKQTIEEYQIRQAQLLEENLKIREEIDQQEAESHQAVKTLLRKYERFRGGIANLNDKFGGDLVTAKRDLEATKRRLAMDLQALQRDVDKLDDQLHKHQGVLHVLVNYKDKEYPVKALNISDLQKEIEQISLNNKEEQDELQYIIDTELEKLRKTQNSEQNDVVESVTKDAIEAMPANLKEMALQNMVMEKELEFHSAEVEELEAINQLLEEEVRKQRRDPKTNLRLQMFPELFAPREKCTPDMDVILDIPTQNWLPI